MPWRSCCTRSNLGTPKAKIQVDRLLGVVFQNPTQNIIADGEVVAPIVLQAQGNALFLPCLRLREIIDDALSYTPVSFARLIGITDLEVRIVGS